MYRSYDPLILQLICPTNWKPHAVQPISTTTHWSYDPVVRELIGPTRQSEYATRSIGPMAHWSYDPIVRLLVGPTHQRIVAVQAVRTIGSMTHWSYGLIFRQPIGHIHCTTNNTNLHWYLSEQWTWFCDPLVVQPIGPTAYWTWYWFVSICSTNRYFSGKKIYIYNRNTLGIYKNNISECTASAMNFHTMNQNVIPIGLSGWQAHLGTMSLTRVKILINMAQI